MENHIETNFGAVRLVYDRNGKNWFRKPNTEYSAILNYLSELMIGSRELLKQVIYCNLICI